MPGLAGRVGGRTTGDAARVSRLLRHFPFYESAVIGDDTAWVGWTGIGQAGYHLLHDEVAGVLAGYHGDGVDGVGEARAVQRLKQVVRLGGTSSLGLAESLDGTFAAARYDTVSGTMTLVTDPFGQRRVYYVVQDGVLHFAPELKGLLVRDELDLAADPAALRDYLNYSYPPGRPHRVGRR